MASVPAITRNALTRPSSSRLLELKQLQCSIFQTTYNPSSARTGAKYLKGRLRGQAMVDYYPATMSYREINRMFPELAVVDEDEVQRLKDLQGRKDRGKGAPPKAKSADESRRAAKKKR